MTSLDSPSVSKGTSMNGYQSNRHISTNLSGKSIKISQVRVLTIDASPESLTEVTSSVGVQNRNKKCRAVKSFDHIDPSSAVLNLVLTLRTYVANLEGPKR